MPHKSEQLLGWTQDPLATLHLGEGGTRRADEFTYVLDQPSVGLTLAEAGTLQSFPPCL